MSLMLSLHIVFLLVWSAALLYFPQLFVRQASDDDDAQHRAYHMQRTLYAYVMTPSALLAVAAGSWLIFERGFSGGWLHVKLTLVLLMVFFHAFCGALMDDFRHERVRRRLWFYRVLPVVPGALITGVITLVVAKPF
ncbi:protoporphyrinogen oxidase HemJ [Noviherbaspirillum agri]